MRLQSYYNVRCPECSGRRYIDRNLLCPMCAGVGKIELPDPGTSPKLRKLLLCLAAVVAVVALALWGVRP